MGRGGCWLGAVLGEILAGAGMAEESGVGVAGMRRGSRVAEVAICGG